MPLIVYKKQLAREHIAIQSSLISSHLLPSLLVFVGELSNGRRSSGTHQGLLRARRTRRRRADDGFGACELAQAAREAVGVQEELPEVLQGPWRHREVRGRVHAAPRRRVLTLQGPDGAVGNAPVGARREAGSPRAARGAPRRHRRRDRLHAVGGGAPRRAQGVPGALPPLPGGGRRLPRQGQELLQPPGRARERVPVRRAQGERRHGEGGGEGVGCGGEERRRGEAGGERRGGQDPHHEEQALPRGDLQVLQGNVRQAHRRGSWKRGDSARNCPMLGHAGQVLQPGDRRGAEGGSGPPREGGPDAGGGDPVGRGHGRHQGGLRRAVRGQARGRHRGQGARLLQGRAPVARRQVIDQVHVTTS